MSNTLSYAYKAAFFTIEAQTNLHVGAGGENFWIIDNLVQRDPATGFPCVYSSSLKGALREYMRDYLLSTDQNHWLADLYRIFGRDKTDDENDLDAAAMSQLIKPGVDPKKYNFPGQFRFLQADLLSIPVQAEGKMYERITSKWLMENFSNQLTLFNHALVPGLKEEDIYGVNFQIKQDEMFCELVDDYHLPVIARNHLVDGSSSNLWYEQVLPRQTRFFFTVLYENTEENSKLFDSFKAAVEKNPVQIGANASIGYGYCRIKQLNTNFKN